jgi:prophage regulatory protein
LLRYEDLTALGLVRSRETLRRWLKAGQFPAPIKIGTRSIAWRSEEVMRWVEERTKQEGTNE